MILDKNPQFMSKIKIVNIISDLFNIHGKIIWWLIQKPWEMLFIYLWCKHLPKINLINISNMCSV